MNRVIDLKNKHRRTRFNAWQIMFIVVFAVVLSTAGIKAADKFLKGPDKLAPGACPDGMVSLLSPNGKFCIDAFEASVGAGCPFASPGSQGESRENLNSVDCLPVSVKGVVPWRNISQNQAATACAKAGKRLPTSNEWMQASLGTPDNLDSWSGDDCQVAKNWASQPGSTGSGANCVSASGVYDMVGNVWEWVQGTIYDGKMGERILPKQGYIAAADETGIPSATADEPNVNYANDYLWIKTSGTRGVARGGYWDNKAEGGTYAVYMVNEPSYAGEGVGFRCVK